MHLKTCLPGPPRPYLGSPTHIPGSPGSCPKSCSPSLGCQTCIPRNPSLYEHPFQGMLRHPYFASKCFHSHWIYKSITILLHVLYCLLLHYFAR